jgi:Zn-dependent M28 family amino/carboxypeptidase
VGSAAAALTPAQIEVGAQRAAKGLKRTVKQLASDRMDGRDNGSAGSVLAQHLLVKRLTRIGDELAQGTGAPYAQPFAQGTNLLAVIPGRELPGEFVVLGSHYDHLAESGCSPEPDDPDDVTCNGASETTGAAIVLAVGKAIHKLPEPPRRSVVLALWDAEKDGLLGSAHYVADPLVPLAQTVAYVNLDVLGTVQLPSLRQNTYVLATETGGDVLRGVVDAAVGSQALTASFLSYAIGGSRGDDASFVEAGVPTLWLTSGPHPCFNSAGDEFRRLDLEKLAEESAIAFRTVVGLAEAETAPVFVAPSATAVYEDAVTMSQILTLSVPADLALYPPGTQSQITATKAAIEAAVAAGEGAFDAADADATRDGTLALGDGVLSLGCPAF